MLQALADDPPLRWIFRPDNLRRARLIVGYTQQQVADRARISKRMVEAYEQGEKQPSLARLCVLAYALDSTPDALLRNDEPFGVGGILSEPF